MQNNSSTINLLLRRIAAFLYDCLLLIALFFVITAVVVPLNEGEAIEHWSYKIVLILIAFLFFDWFWRHGGKQTLQRFLVGLAVFGFTLLYMFGNASGDALHDKLSKTKIIKYYK